MYMTRADLVAASSVAALTGASAPDQDRWRTAAIAAVERFCQQSFVASVETRVIDGSDNKRLALDKRLAILTGLTINAPAFGSSLAITDVALTPNHDALYVTPDAATGGTWATRVMREGRRPEFPAGFGTVEITGTWGWTDAEMPADLTSPVNAAILHEVEDQALAKQHGLAESIRANARLGLRNVSDGRVSALMSFPDIVLSIEAQNLLADYIWEPVGFSA